MANVIQDSCGSEPHLIPIDQALALMRQQVRPLPVELRPLTKALHFTLAQDVVTAVELPPFTQSAVDGYALGSLPVTDTGYQLIGEIRAGESSDVVLQPDQAVRILTGAPLPKGALTVARQEIVKRADDQITVQQAVSALQDIRQQGEELPQGALLASAGQRVDCGVMGALSMAGVAQVRVYRQPRVAVLVSGDEVVQPGQPLALGQVYDANTPLIQGWLQMQGISSTTWVLPDQPDAVAAMLQQLQQEVDLIISSGGVSVGDYDLIRPMSLASGFTEIFWKIRQKPGKPLFFAHATHATHDCLLLGLPGNPAAVFVCLQVYAQQVIDLLAGHGRSLNWQHARLTADIRPDTRERLMRMQLRMASSGCLVQPLPRQQSHMLSNLMQANALVRIPADQAMQAGDAVDILVTRWP